MGLVPLVGFSHYIPGKDSQEQELGSSEGQLPEAVAQEEG